MRDAEMMKKSVTKKDTDFTLVPLRIISNRIARVLAYTPITPNQITISRFIIFIPLIAYFFIRGTYRDTLIGLGLIGVVAIFDLVDGELARIKGMASLAGKWLDTSLDGVFQLSLLCAVAIGVAQTTQNEIYYLVGFLMVFGQSIANVIGFLFEKEFGFDAYAGSAKFDEMYKEVPRISALEWYLKNIIVPKAVLFRTVFCCSYMLLLGILANRLDLFLIIFAVTINIRWVSMYLTYFFFLLRGEKSAMSLFRILKALRVEPPEGQKSQEQTVL